MIVQSNELSQSLLKCFCHFSIRPTKRRFHEETDFKDRDSLSDALASLLNSHLLIPSPPKVSRPPVAALAAAFSTSASFWLAPSSLRTSRSCSNGFAPRQGRHRKTAIVPQRNRQLEVDYFWGVGVHYFNEPVRRLPCRSSSNDPLEL